MENELSNYIKTKSETIFFDALCNNSLGGIGLELDYKQKDYIKAKKCLTSPSFEEVLLQILKNGNTLKVNDFENNGTYNETITLEKVHNRVFTSENILGVYLEGNDDTYTANNLIQWVAYNKIMFA